jgi:hypothetical protein
MVLGVVASLAFFAMPSTTTIGLRNQTLNGWRRIDVR